MVDTQDTHEKLDELGFFQEGFSVLDIGCGVGYIPSYLMKEEKAVNYLGIDVDMGAIQECRHKFRQDKFSFKRLNVYSELYNPLGIFDPKKIVLPVDSDSVDSIVCHSLFTHLDSEEVASRYMSEIKRVLKQGGFLWTTWFTDPPNTVSDGTRRTVYDLGFIHSLLEAFEPIYLSGGETQSYHDQLEIACVR